MSILFKPLFTLAVTHAYYGGPCRDVGFVLPPDTVLPLIEDDTREAMKSALESKANVHGAPSVADAPIVPRKAP